LAGRTCELPEGSPRPFRARTLWAWWSAYQRHGLEGLLPKARADRGALRALTPTLLAEAVGLRQEIPSRSTATLIHILETQGRILHGQLPVPRSIVT